MLLSSSLHLTPWDNFICSFINLVTSGGYWFYTLQNISIILIFFFIITLESNLKLFQKFQIRFLAKLQLNFFCGNSHSLKFCQYDLLKEI